MLVDLMKDIVSKQFDDISISRFRPPWFKSESEQGSIRKGKRE